MEQAFTLALINSRVYQFKLEQLYLAALAVTLQRFAFTPQFYAGLSPTTAVPQGLANVPAAFPGTTTTNIFNYATKETGQQVSTLNIGTVAGVGKVFSSGARLLAGLRQPDRVQLRRQELDAADGDRRSCRSRFVQPFLRGGGRAVTLEAADAGRA